MNATLRFSSVVFIIIGFVLVLITGITVLAWSYDENSPSHNSDAIPTCSPEWLTSVPNGGPTAVASLPADTDFLPTCRLKGTAYIVPTEEVDTLSRPSTQKP